MRERPQHSQIIQAKEKTCGQNEALQTNRQSAMQTSQKNQKDRQDKSTVHTDRQTEILCNVHTHILEKK